MIQEGQRADDERSALERGLAELGRDHFGDAPGDTSVRWVALRAGWAFTADKPSTSSIVVRSVPEGLSLDRREAFMHGVCRLWEDVTGCTTDEIVVTAWDGPLPL